MARLPFDPQRAKGPAKSAAKSQPRVWTVSQLASVVAEAIELSVPMSIAVAGEVSQPRESTHLYFTLKDASAGMQGVMFASTLRRAATRPEHGQQVIAHGKLSYFKPQGRVSLIVDRVEPVGKGALEEQLRKLADELRAQGWFEASRKRPLPTLPRRVAVITSKSGAALQDVLDTFKRRCPSVEIVVVGAKMQGEGSAAQITRALQRVSNEHEHLGIDVVIATRGGGSIEDLWSFNDREVARAVLESAIPVVAAIGHETDTTIIELVADVRAATPTQAAMRVAPDAQALFHQLDQLGDRLATGVRRSVRDARYRLGSLSEHSVLADPESLLSPSRDRLALIEQSCTASMASVLAGRRGQLDRLTVGLDRHRPAALQATRRERLRNAANRLGRAGSLRLGRNAERIAALQRELDAVGPRAVLERGFSCTMHERGGLVRAASEVEMGERVRTLTADGGFDSVVRRTRHDPIEPKQPPTPAEPKIEPRGLFDLTED